MIGWIYLFSGNKGFLNVRYEFDKEEAGGVNWSFIGHKMSANLSFPFVYGINVNGFTELNLQRFDDTHTVFGLTREDDVWTAGVAVSRKLGKWLEGVVKYTHTTSDSTLPLYDYNRNITGVFLNASY